MDWPTNRDTVPARFASLSLSELAFNFCLRKLVEHVRRSCRGARQLWEIRFAIRQLGISERCSNRVGVVLVCTVGLNRSSRLLGELAIR